MCMTTIASQAETLLDPNKLVEFMDTAGFNFRDHPSESFDLDDGLTLRVSGINKTHYLFNFVIEGLGLVTSLTASELHDKVNVSIQQHDSHSFFSDLHESLQVYEATQCTIFRARLLAVRLAKQLTQPAMLSELRTAALLERDQAEAKIQQQREKTDQRRLQIIADHERKYRRLGTATAQAIVTAMQDDCDHLEDGESASRDFMFLQGRGASLKPVSRTLALCNEEGGSRVWRDPLGNQIDASRVIELMAKAWVLKQA